MVFAETECRDVASTVSDKHRHGPGNGDTVWGGWDDYQSFRSFSTAYRISSAVDPRESFSRIRAR